MVFEVTQKINPGRWIDISKKLNGLPELQVLCDMARETEHIIDIIMVQITRGNVRPDYYVSMKVLLYRFSTALISVSRKYADIIDKSVKETTEDSTALKEMDKLADEIKNSLEFTEVDENEITAELTNRPLNFPRITKVIAHVETSLVRLENAMMNAIQFKQQIIMTEFLLSLMRSMKITVSVETINKYKEATKGGTP